MTVQEMIEKIPSLSLQERQQLMHALVDSMADMTDIKEYSLLDFAGIGASLRDGQDAQEYVNQLRREWDHRP